MKISGIWTLVLCSILATGVVIAEPRNPQYREAMKAMKAKDYETAASLFGQIVAQGEDDVDAALYWQAFATHKTGKSDQALQTLNTLRTEWPQSSWADDAQALTIEIRAAMGLDPDPDDHGDMDMKLIALAGVLHSQPDRAMDQLETILTGEHSDELKERALFVLIQKPSQRGAQLLQKIASSSESEDLRRSAIHTLAAGNFQQSKTFLLDLYRQSANNQTRMMVLDGLRIMGEGDSLVQLVDEEKDPEMLQALAQSLGILKKTQSLAKLYAGDFSNEVKESVLHGLFLAGEKQMISQIAANETDPELFESAIHSLFLAGGCEEAKEIYAATQDTNRKIALIEPAFLNKKCNLLQEVLENETDPELISMAIRGLSLGGSDNSSLLKELYKDASDLQTKKALSEAFFLMRDVDQLIVIAREDESPVIRKAAVQWLSLMKSQKATNFLLSIINE